MIQAHHPILTRVVLLWPEYKIWRKIGIAKERSDTGDDIPKVDLRHL